MLLTILWLLAIIFVNPIGEFPLNDDWVYTYSVRQLLAGNWHILDIVSMSLAGQVIWGTLFCLPLGFSYLALRLSVVLLGYLGVLGSYQLFSENGVNTKWALLGAILIGFNPIYFSLSFTFMTDVPFLTLCIWALVYYYRALKRSTYFPLFVAALLSVFAVWIRQVGIFLPIAFLGYHWIQKRWTIRAFLPLLITLSGMWLLNMLQQETGNVHNGEGQVSDLLAQLLSLITIWRRLFLRTGWILLYFGLFLLPFTLATTRATWREIPLKTKKYLALIGLPFIIALFRGFPRFPEGNIFYNLGLGPKTLRDVHILDLNNFTVISPMMWTVIKVLAFLGGLLLLLQMLYAVWRLFEAPKSSVFKGFTWFSFLLYVPFITLFPLFFDRYILPLFILTLFGVLLNISTSLPFKLSFKAILPCVILVSFSLFCTKDYLNWNRLRWQAMTYLQTQEQANYKEIEGGYECNEPWLNTTEITPLYYDYLQSFGKEELDRNLKYVIAFGELPNYKVLKKYEYQRYIPFQQEAILILKRAN